MVHTIFKYKSTAARLHFVHLTEYYIHYVIDNKTNMDRLYIYTSILYIHVKTNKNDHFTFAILLVLCFLY